MDWVKLGTRYYDDEAIEGLDDAAELMFVRGIARAGELEREGFIPDSSLPKLTRRRRYEALVEQLIAAGLWSRVAGGYQVARWADWQDALDDLARRRAGDRERQRRRRERLRTESAESRDTDETSRDVTRTEEELDKELKGGREVTYVARDEPPPNRCPKHRNDKNPPNCWGCADARREHSEWQAEQSKRLATMPQCRIHRGQLAHACSACRSEELAPA